MNTPEKSARVIFLLNAATDLAMISRRREAEVGNEKPAIHPSKVATQGSN